MSESVEAEQQFGLGAPASASMALSHRNLRTREIRSLVFLLSPGGYFLGMDGSSTMPVSRSREPGHHTPHRSSMISMPQFSVSVNSPTVITIDPNELMEPIHNRMPVILQRQDYERWLAPGDPAQLPVDLLRPYPAEEMKAWRVSSDVGNVRNNRPELIEPI